MLKYIVRITKGYMDNDFDFGDDELTAMRWATIAANKAVDDEMRETKVSVIIAPVKEES